MVGQKFVCFTLILLIIGTCTNGLPPPPSSTLGPLIAGNPQGPLIAGNPRGKREVDVLIATPTDKNETILSAVAPAIISHSN